MNSAILFVVTALVILFGWMGWSLRKMSWEEKKAYFKTRDGLGILKGVALSVGISFILVLLTLVLGCSPANTQYGSFNNGASVFAGLDYTKKVSPMCEDGGQDSHTTSNLGLKYHFFETPDTKFKINGKYTHHSCAFGLDDKQYDGAGVELEYKLW